MAALRRTPVDAAPLPLLWKVGPLWAKSGQESRHFPLSGMILCGPVLTFTAKIRTKPAHNFFEFHL